MDNMDTCCLEDQEKMASNKVWQWRIMCGKKHSVRLEPFHHSNRIGLDFNVASNTQKQMDLQVVTNGVILEVCDFAKTVNKSKGHFITNILQNNFDLGLENEKQLTDFTAQILHKAKHLIKKPPKDKKEVFTLFDTSSKPECKTNNGLNIASAERKTGSFMVEMDDTDDHGDEYTCSQAASKEYIKTESLLEDMEVAHSDDDEDEFKDSGAMSAEELMEDVSLPKFPYCEGICLNLDVGSKQSLDLGLLTKGVMLELVHFSKILTASFRLIVLKVLEHNFELDLKGQQGKNQIWFRILHLLKRRDGLITTGSEISMEFINEPFSFQTNSFIESRGSALSNMELQQKPFLLEGHRRGKSKDMETNTLSQHTELCTTRTAEGDHCQTGSISEFDLDSYTGNACDKEQEEMETENDHTCPQGKTVLDLDNDTNSGSQNHKSCSLSSDTSSLPTVNSNLNPWFASQPDERKPGRSEELTQTPKNAPTECDMEQEELRTENNMWKLRANRVKQILSAKEFGPFHESKRFGLEFNIGFGPKQNFSVDSRFDYILVEIAKFAIAMNSSQQNFIMEILEYNFDISLESEYQRNIFTCEIMKRVGQLKDCEDAVKCSKEVFELHGPIPSISMANQSMASVNAELNSISRMEECDVACGFPPHSQAETEEHVSQKCVDLYPFCKEISLKLNVNNTRPNKKPGINKLTYGAMAEVTNFAEKLCGKFDQICVDILKHNLDLDSQCADSDLARSIARIPAILEQRKLSSYVNSQKQIHKSRRYSTNVKLDPQNNPNADAACAGSSQAAIIDHDVNSSPDIKHQNESKLKLWQLRANHIQQILSIPHEDQCPLYSYSRCKKLGIDFNVGSGVKQNLDPKLLTNGIMVEIGTFAAALLSAQKYFITEILEYNFHLYFDNELYRRAFAEKTLIKMKNKKLLNKRAFHLKMKTQFKLPDTRWRPEPTFERSLYCPKCYQVRIHKHHRDESDSRHIDIPCPPTSADSNLSAQNDPSSTFSIMEEMIMDSYPHCKEIGLSLCVDKDQPKDKLDMHVLTYGTIMEVASFAERLCGTNYSIFYDILQYNFNIGLQGPDVNPAMQFHIEMKQSNGLLSWLNEVFVIKRSSDKQLGNVRKMKQAVAIHGSELKETIKKRKLAMQTQQKTSKTNPLGKENGFSTSPKISLTPGKKEKLDLKQMTKSVCDMDQEEVAPDNDYTHPLGESDLDSDELTDLENSGNKDNLQIPKLSLSSDTSSLPTVNSNLNQWFASQPDETRLGGSEELTQTPKNVPTEWDMEQEGMETENNMWKLRANRVTEILSTEEFCRFGYCKSRGLEFNVGFGPKKNFIVDSRFDSILLEIAKFAIAMNSSQQYFIMEILEYNFDISLNKNVFTCEIMKRVRQLKDCEDAVKFSKEVFELNGPIPSTSMANQSMASVNAELNSISRMEECDVACGFPAHSQAETEEHVSQKCVDLYPFCKEISLKLHVNNTRPNKKLGINKLTYGAMTEVTIFAEKLCGTFDQICVDILKHNLDLNAQCGDSDLARSIVARIPAVLEQKKLSSYINSQKQICKSGRNPFTNVKLDSQNYPNADAACAGSCQAAIINQEVNSSPDIEHQKEFELKLWQLRANHIQQILSIPHEEQCPLYSYSRCKKVGIDFNVGSGVKTNLDPKLLTNGIMVEIGTFAAALLSAQKYFITEILEYNFPLYFNNELYCCAFSEKNLIKMKKNELLNKNAFPLKMKTQFKLPDTSYRPDPTFQRSIYCPKCYQVRNHKNRRDESDSGHMDNPCPPTSADANCSAQKPAKDPSHTFSAIEAMIIDSYPLCMKIGLSLCVDKDQPKDKLDTDVLTHGTMWEVACFAKRLCGTKHSIINDVLQHNFNIGLQGPDVNPAMKFYRKMIQSNGLLSWLNEVFVIQPLPRIVSNKKPTEVVHSELMESIKKRKLALQTKVKTDTRVVKNPEKKLQSQGCYPICTEMGLDLDVTSNSEEKEKLDLGQLTRAVVFEIHKFAISKPRCYIPQTVYEILDYNFDISSQHHRSWEFSLTTASLVNIMVKEYQKYRNDPGTVFKLPFVFDRQGLQINGKKAQKRKSAKYPCEVPGKKTNKSNFVQQARYQSDKNCVKMQTRENAPPEWDKEQEKMETKNNMWKLRANRVQEILSAKEFCLFGHSKTCGLEFNVGFGPKKNFNVDSLLDSILLEIAKFAVAMNASQQNFIMEILEYNFDIRLNRNIFLSEIMNRVRQLKDCEDTVQFSKEIFELPGLIIPSTSMVNESVASVNAELNSIPRMEACDVSQKCVNPFKEISLKFNVNDPQPTKKLDINKLTYGTMTEVTNFAEKLCGTFEQICVDIVKHNVDLDAKCGNSQLTRNIVARISTVLKQRKLSSYVKSQNKVHNSRSSSSTNVRLDPQNNSNSDASGAGSSQAAIIDQEVNGSPEMELELKLWQLRKNHIEQILSIPHEEHCPLYSYSRCQKVGIDFNVGSGVKQNLDPKLLTNGVMVEIGTFATDMLSAQKYFITEILQYNFHLDFNNDFNRLAFAEKTLAKIKSKKLLNTHAFPQMKTQFKLPDTRCTPDHNLKRTIYCPKCYQARNHKNRQDVSGSGHMHHPRPQTMTDAGSADASCSAQKPAKDPSSTFSGIEEMIMDGYPQCKEIGLSLCVDKDQPKDKLDTEVLTNETIGEVASFAQRLCGTKYSIFYDVLQHNFNIRMQGPDVNHVMQFHREMKQSNGLLSWLKKVFVIKQLPISQPVIVCNKKPTTVVHRSVVKQLPIRPPRIVSKKKLTVGHVSQLIESKKRRHLALQTKEKTEPHPSVVKNSEKEQQSQGRRCPMDTKMGQFVRQARYRSDENCVYFLDGAKLNKANLFCNEDPEVPTDPVTIVQINRGQVDAGCGGLLQGNLQIKEEEYDPRYCNIKPEPEPDTEKQGYPLHDDVKTESSASEAEPLVPDEPTELLENSFLKSENENLESFLAEPQGCDASPNTDGTIKTEQDTEDVNYLVPVEAAGCLGYSMVIIGECDESTLIKEEQDNV